jgi:hypothetical protein
MSEQTIFVFDVICPRERYSNVVRLHLRGGGGHAVDRHSLGRHSDVRVGERLAFANADGVGSCALVDVVGVTFANDPNREGDHDA